MTGWHHWINGHEFVQTPGDGEGWGSLACCSPWGYKESDVTERLNNNNNKSLLGSVAFCTDFSYQNWTCRLKGKSGLSHLQIRPIQMCSPNIKILVFFHVEMFSFIFLCKVYQVFSFTHLSFGWCRVKDEWAKKPYWVSLCLGEQWGCTSSLLLGQSSVYFTLSQW